MNEKIIVVILHTLLLGSCVSTRPVESVVIEHSRNIERLQDANERLTNIIDSSAKRVDNIRERASGVENAIDRLGLLFTEYEREVERLLGEITELRDKIAKAEKGDFSWLSDTYFVNNHESVDYLFED